MTETNAGAESTPPQNTRSEARPDPTEKRSSRESEGSGRSKPDDAPGRERSGASDGSDRTGRDDRPAGGADGDASEKKPSNGGASSSSASEDGSGGSASRSPRRRRRGSRGGRGRSGNGPADASTDSGDDPTASGSPSGGGAASESATTPPPPPSRRPQIGDTRPAPAPAAGSGEPGKGRGESASKGDSGGSTGSSGSSGSSGGRSESARSGDGGSQKSGGSRRRRRRGGRGRGGGGGQGGGGQGGGREAQPVTAITDADPVELDEKTLSRRRGRERKGKPVGRYLMAVHVQESATQISVLEGKSLIEHHVSRPADEVTQIHGNIYLGRVQNVLPGMEAAFVDIGTPKNAVLYRGDTRIDPTDVDERSDDLRIEQMLKPKQAILCQVTKNPIGAKGARLTQEISLPGRFVVLVPHSGTYGISKRLPDNERKRLRQILDKVKPDGHGLIVRTAAEGISAPELAADVERLAAQWEQIEKLAGRTKAPALLYRDPDLSIRVIREEFNQDYRQVVIDDREVFDQVRDYVRSISPALVERVELYDPAEHGGLSLFEAHHIHEQLHKALDRKVWLRSGGSLIIERTEALTVIDVNTGKNVGKSNLEETVFKNNLEAAEEVARQLRLRDIGGIIVIDFIDMEEKAHRDEVMVTFRRALARDKTRTQVFDISELGLVEMTRKRIGEGLLESLSVGCPACEGRGLVFDEDLVPS